VTRLRHGGVYLITGGTGGIGLTIAQYLAQTCRAKIVLTKKTPFPDKSTWRELAAAGGASERVSRIIKALLQIEDAGAEVDVFVAESSSKAQMQGVIDETRRKFGTINGVIHAAGIVRAGLIMPRFMYDWISRRYSFRE
jgi:NAD(P)-dependent dehydrogenase (short-subunit alcohol dehydrogenase family)